MLSRLLATTLIGGCLAIFMWGLVFAHFSDTDSASLSKALAAAAEMREVAK